MTTRTITITGARGGQGTSTVAAAVALLAAGHARTVLASADPRSMAALLGVPATADLDVEITPTLRLSDRPAADDEVLVVDAGTSPLLAGEDRQGEHYAVLRGPCYLALASLVAAPGPPPDGVILVVEPGRSLTATDVTEVLGVPVVATVEVNPAVARTIDAGLLAARLHRLHQLKPLRSLVGVPTTNPTTATPAPSRRHPSAPLCQTPAPSPTRHTDLPFPPSGNGRMPRAPVKKVTPGVSGSGLPMRIGLPGGEGRLRRRTRPGAQHRPAQRRRRRLLPR
jgi:hypothetical protein